MRFFIILFLCHGVGLAQDKVIIQSVDQGTKLDSLDPKKYEAREGLPDEPESPPYMESTADVDEKLRAADLGKEISQMDRMDRDLLFLKAGSFDARKLEAAYPKIAPEKLKKLISVIKKKKS